jgi:predicted double-glycine peptidase
MISIARLLAAGSAATALLAASPGLAQTAFDTGIGRFSAPVTSMRDMPFRTVVRQKYDYSCGSAALATLLRYHYGRDVDEAQIFRAMYAHGDQPQIRKLGFSLLDMKTYLTAIGMPSDGYRETLADLAASHEPAIAVIVLGSYRHFVVVKGVRDGRVMVGDPALGLMSYPLGEFAKVWNGIAFKIRAEPMGAFNRRDEWGSFLHARTDPLSDRDLASFTRTLPPLYQITLPRTFQ